MNFINFFQCAFCIYLIHKQKNSTFFHSYFLLLCSPKEKKQKKRRFFKGVFNFSTFLVSHALVRIMQFKNLSFSKSSERFLEKSLLHCEKDITHSCVNYLKNQELPIFFSFYFNAFCLFLVEFVLCFLFGIVHGL
ncbi:hypothetical protein C8N46_106284 [Kordia periserrulae]|uniref:Transmembrane protein n=1 Tax=Kordia periserrulae TaxID=701523 RepID=A0A2T6BX39_9FLAO|nr:hypothetical protein C8N46_106284 [Kordia periserrulae]